MGIKDSKKQLRKKISLHKQNLSPEFLSESSAIIIQQLEAHPLFKKASCIALYHALPDEVQTAAFIEKWHSVKNILLPVVEGEDIRFYPYKGKEKTKTGCYGICEPDSCETDEDLPPIDLAVIPGVAFDRTLNRMGRGKGYYDRFLSGTTVPKIGLCFDFQLHDTIPSEPFDIKMDIVITECDVIPVLKIDNQEK